MSKKIASRNTDSQPRDKKKKLLTRTNLLYAGSIVILVIIIVTFIGGPIASSQTETGISFGSYEGKEIRYIQGSYFANAVQYFNDIYSRTLSPNDPNYNLNNSFIWQEAFNQTVNFYATLAAADRSGIVIAGTRIDEEIINSPLFQENGVFLLERYKNSSNQELFELEKSYVESLKVEQVRDDLVADEILSAQEVEYLQTMTPSRKSLYLVEFSEEMYPDENIVAWAGENTILTRRRSLSSITVYDDREAVQEIYDGVLAAPESFEESARLYSTDEFSSQGGTRGQVYAFDLLDLLSEESLQRLYSDDALEENGISELLAIEGLDDAFIFFQANGKIEEFDASDAVQISDLGTYIEGNHPEVITNYVTGRAESFVEAAQDTSFLEAAIVEDLDYIDLEGVPLAYGSDSVFKSIDTSQYPILFTAFQRDNFLKELFTLKTSAISKPISVRNSSLVFSVYDEQSITEEEIASLEESYTEQANQFRSNQFEDFIVNDALLVDNFRETFNQYIYYEAPVEEAIEEELFTEGELELDSESTDTPENN